MEVLMWYALFALTTSFAAMYELFIPVMQELEVIAGKNNNVVEYKFVTYTTFFLMSLLFAPLLLPSCIIPSFGARFKGALLNSLR